MSDFKAKMHQIRFQLGLCPRPRWRSLHAPPNPLAGFKGLISEGRGGEKGGLLLRAGRGKEGKERGPTSKSREGSGGEGRGGEG